MKEINANIAVDAVFSDDGKHRYALTYEWSKKPKLTILMIAPGRYPNISEPIALGLTETLCLSNSSKVSDQKYGGVNIINLFSKVPDDYAQTTKRDCFKGATNEENDEIIMKLIEGTDIAFAFGSVIGTNKIAYLRALELVEKIEEKHPDRLFCCHDGVRKFLHPLDIYTRNEFRLLPVKNVADYIREHSKFGEKEKIIEKKTAKKQVEK